jgi:hypothetical protein
MAPPNRPPVRRSAAGRPPPPARSDTVPEAQAVVPEEASAVSRRRVARRAKEPEKKKSKAPLVIVLLLLVGVAAAGYWKMTQKPPPPSGPDPVALETAELTTAFQAGKNLVRQGKWTDAAQKFNAIIAVRPDFADGAVKTYLAAAEREVPNQKHFDDATAALDRNEVGNAHRALAAVSADTQQVARRDALQTRQAEIFKARILEAQGLAQAGGDAKMRKLKALAEDLLVARPEDRDALEFKSIADRALRIRVAEKVEVPVDDPALKVQSTYAGGDAAAALAGAAACAAESASCRTLEGKMSELNGLLKRLETLQPAELETALRLDRQIAGGKSSPQSKQIATRIGAVFYRKASAAKVVGDWAQVMQNALKVLDAEPAHAGAQSMANEGRERARELYLRCYQQRQTEPEQAVPLCNEVISMLPPGDSQREKAEKVIQALRAK